jgi:integrase
MEFINNPHCNKPFLAKDGTNWYIQFWYNSDGKRSPKKFAYSLNSDEFRPKIKGRFVEVNKAERKKMVDIYLAETTRLLKTQYFNPVTKKFEILDEAENSFISFIERFISNPHSTKEPSTIRTYNSYLKIFTEYLIGQNLIGMTLKEVTKPIINKYLIQFKTATHSNGNLRFLKAVLNYCVDTLEVIPQSPLKNIKHKAVTDSDSNKPYTPDEFQRLLSVAKSIDNEFYILLLFQYYSLRRPTEILKLQYKDFDFANNSVYFSGNITKTNKRQTAILPEFFMNLIRNQVPANTQPDSYFLGTVKEKNGRHHLKVFNVKPITLMYFQDKFKTKAIQDIVKEGQTIYSTKHSGVIYLKTKGYDNSQIMALTGHTNEASLGVYAREYKAKPITRTDNVLID